MKWWRELIRDVLLTGTGIGVIISQIGPHPSTPLLLAGLALTTPAATIHAASLLSGNPSPYSPPPEPPGPQSLPPSPDPGGTGEPAAHR